MTGHFLGTEGYAPPESYRDAHSVGPRGDLYGVGQIVGWAKSGEHPLPNVQAQAPEPWGRFARLLTGLRPEQRPASAAEALRLLEQGWQAQDRGALVAALERAQVGDQDAALSACLKAVDRRQLLLPTRIDSTKLLPD